MTNVLIVDDERIPQALFSHYIATASDRYHLVGAIKGAANAEIACLNTQIDLILMDICTANGESGLAATAAVKRKYPKIKIIMVTSAPEVSFLDKARAAGAESFWYKEAGTEELLTVMDRTMAGENIYPDTTPRIQVGEAVSTEFTPTEIKVLYYLMEGKSMTQIAGLCNVDYETTRTHIKNLREKTGATSITELTALVAGSRLILPKY